MRIIEIDSNTFESLDGFYDKIEKHLLLGDCPWGRNLDSLNEIVFYNFNYTENTHLNVSKIVWLNFEKAKLKINEKRGSEYVVDILEEIFRSNKEITFEKK